MARSPGLPPRPTGFPGHHANHAMSTRLITRPQVAELLPMGQAIELMRRGFAALGTSEVVMPRRQRLETAEGDILLKPAYLRGQGLSVKLVLTYPGNPARGLPLVQGLMMVFDETTGSPLAVMDAAELTAIRTGAGGGLAVDLLARQDSRVVALIGAGVQARTQLLAAMEVRAIEQVHLFDPDPAACQRLVEDMASRPGSPPLTPVADVNEGVAAADIVITATTSPVPTFRGEALRPGTHVSAIGAYQPDRREIDEEGMRRSYVVVDGHEAAGVEAGELMIPGIQADADLCEVLTAARPGRRDDEQITLFKSVGMAIQDAVSAAHVLEEANRLGVGVEIDLGGGGGTGIRERPSASG